MLKSLLFSVAFVFAGTLFPQNYEVTHYTVEDGLMSNEINGVFQDSLGVIWVSNGLSSTSPHGNRIININRIDLNKLSF